MSKDKNNENGNQQQDESSGVPNPFDVHLETSSLKIKIETKNDDK